MMIIDDLNILTYIFSYLDSSDLLTVSLCSKEFRLASIQDDTWMNLTKRLWKLSKYEFNVPKIHNIHDRLSISTSMKSLLRIMALNRIDRTRCVEKSEFVAMVVAHLVFTSRRVNIQSKKYIEKSKSRVFYPDWSLKIHPGKASYYYSKAEIGRHEIYMSELCAIDWEFMFIESQEQTWNSRFYHDYTMSSELHDNVMSWRVRLLHYTRHSIHLDVTSVRQESSRSPNDSSSSVSAAKELETGQWTMET